MPTSASFSRPDVIAYEKNATSSADEFRRKRRIACRAFNTHLHLKPTIMAAFGSIDRYKYVSHKVLRWFGIVPLALAVVATIAALLIAEQYVALAVGATAGFAALALAVVGISPFSVMLEILIALIATFYGVVDSWKGRTYQIWTPAQSRS